jgi:hypothetical protein
MLKERSYDGDQIRGDTLDKQLFAIKIRSRVLHVTPNVVNPFKTRIKSHLLFAGIISSRFFPR